MNDIEATFAPSNNFDYDYQSVQTTGLILAGIMFVSGIVIALSNKFKCRKSPSGERPKAEEGNVSQSQTTSPGQVV
uniref:FXYD domain-containing ion transport regulator n=1 Tax=Callorhinchus milii TaxID=7868 RepID=V9LJX7_CALMI